MGKTTISKMFRDLGIPVWCADTEVNKLYEKNGAATKVFSNELPNVVTEKGIDKKKLRNLIHKDGRILKKIEAIVHPLLGGSKTDFIKKNNHFLFIVFDIPLLLEKNQEKNFDAVLVVTASEKTQRNRVLSRENMAEKDFHLIKQNQLNEEEKIKRADYIINTDKSLQETKRDVLLIHNKIKKVLS